jgi:23S rRNA pseudouridine1911/1915/1917 synthase
MRPKEGSILAPKVLFENDFFLVLDKPAGWVVNRAGTCKQKTLQDWLEENFSFPIFRQPECRSGIVHRLDKETSGLLLVAKTISVFKELQGQFKQRAVSKKYLALVHGKVVPEKGLIRAPVARNPVNRKKFGVFLGGREAVTEYSTLANYQHLKENFTLLELRPLTGRTHQIRVHLKYLGYPVVGDLYYAGRKTARKDRQLFPSHFLHAASLSFFHPESKKVLSFASPLPENLKKGLAQLKNEKKV